MTIAVLNEAVDLGHEVSDATERLPTTDTLHDDVEPAFHPVEPGGIGRGVGRVTSFLRTEASIWCKNCKNSR